MMDWILDHLGWFCGGLCLIVIVVFILAVNAANKESARIMRQCMDDGKKEYECKAMLKQDVMPMPIILPR
jgi:hypothetical protein